MRIENSKMRQWLKMAILFMVLIILNIVIVFSDKNMTQLEEIKRIGDSLSLNLNNFIIFGVIVTTIIEIIIFYNLQLLLIKMTKHQYVEKFEIVSSYLIFRILLSGGAYVLFKMFNDSYTSNVVAAILFAPVYLMLLQKYVINETGYENNKPDNLMLYTLILIVLNQVIVILF